MKLQKEPRHVLILSPSPLAIVIVPHDNFVNMNFNILYRIKKLMLPIGFGHIWYIIHGEMGAEHTSRPQRFLRD